MLYAIAALAGCLDNALGRKRVTTFLPEPERSEIFSFFGRAITVCDEHAKEPALTFYRSISEALIMTRGPLPHADIQNRLRLFLQFLEQFSQLLTLDDEDKRRVARELRDFLFQIQKRLPSERER